MQSCSTLQDNHGQGDCGHGGNPSTPTRWGRRQTSLRSHTTASPSMGMYRGFSTTIGPTAGGPTGGSSTFGGCRCLQSRGGVESNTWRSLTKKAYDVHGSACIVLLCHYTGRAVLGSGYQARHGGLTCITPSHDMVVVGSLARACPSHSSSDGITCVVIGVELAMGAVSGAYPGRSSSIVGIPSGDAGTQLAVGLAVDHGPHLRRQQRVVE
jgi:hypothetical protein